MTYRRNPDADPIASALGQRTSAKKRASSKQNGTKGGYWRALRTNVVATISYRCRDIGYGIEEDTIEGFWTGEVDAWGKHTIRRIDGGPTLYLFKDEITNVERL